MSYDKRERKSPHLPRREFLANILFAGGALTLSSFQGELLAFTPADPKEGWELPEDGESKQNDDGWSLPEDLLDSPKEPNPRCRPPRPRPCPLPYPNPAGGPRPPHILGRVTYPRPSPHDS